MEWDHFIILFSPTDQIPEKNKKGEGDTYYISAAATFSITI